VIWLSQSTNDRLACRKEIEALPLAAQTAVLVMLREMRNSGPHPEAYSVKPLSRNLQGLTQANLKVRKEHIRVIYAVYGIQNCAR
jgi:hypothetical protein